MWPHNFCVTVHHWRKPKQELKVGAWKRTQKSWRGATYWLSHHHFLSLLSSTTQDHLVQGWHHPTVPDLLTLSLLHLGSIASAPRKHESTSCFLCQRQSSVSLINWRNKCHKLRHYNVPDFLKVLGSPSSKRTSEKEVSEGAFFCSSFKLWAICYMEKQERTLKCLSSECLAIWTSWADVLGRPINSSITLKDPLITKRK